MTTRNDHRTRPRLTVVDNPPDKPSRRDGPLSAVHPPPTVGTPVAIDPATGRLTRGRHGDPIDVPACRRRGRLLVAPLLVITAHGLLAATIAGRAVPPLLGATAAGGLAICGLILIAAELVNAATQHRANGRTYR